MTAMCGVQVRNRNTAKYLMFGSKQTVDGCGKQCVLSKEDDLALAMGLEFEIEGQHNDGG